jgi:hypothetical protein
MVLPAPVQKDTHMTEKLDTGSRLMITIFQQVFLPQDDERDPKKYLKKYATDIKLAGQLFEYLGLAQIDERSPLGWKPTDQLVDIIAKKSSAPIEANRKVSDQRRWGNSGSADRRCIRPRP